jgi:hypothetical protein
MESSRENTMEHTQAENGMSAQETGSIDSGNNNDTTDATRGEQAPLHINTADLLTRIHSHGPDSPTTMLITTLRDELLTLTDQSTILNAKLLASLDRVATLEDTVYQATSAQREKEEQIRQLEKAKAQWEESMNTGLLVERKVVKEEMQRLVEGLVEEERRRGSAEEGRARVEREVDDLSATLFEQVSRRDGRRASNRGAKRRDEREEAQTLDECESRSEATRRARGGSPERSEKKLSPERSEKKLFRAQRASNPSGARRKLSLFPSAASITSHERSENPLSSRAKRAFPGGGTTDPRVRRRTRENTSYRV